jgi:putative redox protein
MSALQTERIEFPGARGERLAARLEHPSGQPVAFALFTHCFTCSKDLKPIRRISRSLAERGIAVLRFDFTGLGESEGDFTETDFSSNIEDVVAAADFLRERYEAPQILVGHSLGGTAALMAAARIQEVRAVATIAAPSDTDHLRELLAEKAPAVQQGETAEINLGGRAFRIKRQLLDDLAEHGVHDAIAELRRPVLVFHSPLDNIVAIDHARRIFEAAKHPKSFISLDNADHLLLGSEDDSQYVADMLATWAMRYVGRKSFAPADEEKKNR